MTPPLAGRRVLVVAGSALTPWRFGAAEHAALVARGAELHVAAAPDGRLERVAARDGARAHPVPLARRGIGLGDLRSLLALVRVTRHVAPDLVVASTPKAALLGMLAAWWCGVPRRVFLIRGLVGRSRLLCELEALTARLATDHLVVSPSLLALARARGVLRQDEGEVLGDGMSAGVEPVAPSPRSPGPPIVGFVGRLGADKGIALLADAWARIGAAHPGATLRLIGEWDPNDPVPEPVRQRLLGDPRVVLTGWVDDPAPHVAGLDLLLLPSAREGFPNAPMEAAALGVPTVATRVTGTTDAVLDGVTGRLVPPGDAGALAEAAIALLADPAARHAMGDAARARVEERFTRTVVSARYVDYYQRRLAGPGRRGGWYATWGKRTVDLLASAALLVLTAPLLLALALAVRHRLGGPILFRQARPGRDGRPFTLVKFRTMRDATGPDGAPLPDAERLDPFGQWLRATSLDELPELWNVLRGDMSLVGPRPLLIEYLPRYSAVQRRRHELRPGVTGWAQVQGRNLVDWPERLALDVWYVDHFSWSVDLRILGRTVGQVARRHGIAAPGEATMAPFRGESER